MSRSLVKIEKLPLSKEAMDIYSNSTVSFYEDPLEILEGYYMHDISNADRQPLANLTFIGNSIEDIEEFLLSSLGED